MEEPTRAPAWNKRTMAWPGTYLAAVFLAILIALLAHGVQLLLGLEPSAAASGAAAGAGASLILEHLRRSRNTSDD